MKTNPGMPAQTGQQGFTLIEAIIALAILAIGILGVGAMQIGALSGNSEAKQVFRSVTLSTDHFERLMTLPVDDPQLQENPRGRSEPLANRLNFTDGVGGAADHSFADPLNNLTLFWNVADNYPVRGCKTIRVIVRRFGQGLDKTQAKETRMDLVRLTRHF